MEPEIGPTRVTARLKMIADMLMTRKGLAGMRYSDLEHGRRVTADYTRGKRVITDETRRARRCARSSRENPGTATFAREWMPRTARTGELRA